jgi:hypothetical protein
MAAAKTNPAAMPPPLPPPPAQPVSGITPQRKAIAPTLTDAPKGADPVKELAARQKAAIAARDGSDVKAQEAEAREGAPTPPKAKTTASGSSKADAASPGRSGQDAGSKSTDTGGSTKPASTSEESSSAEQAAADDSAPADGTAPGAPRGPRYTWQALRKYAEEHPEEAADLRKAFDLPEDTREEWIRLKNRGRKLKNDIAAERDKTTAEVKAERAAAEAAKTAIDDAAAKLGPIADLWEACGERIRANPDNPSPDFEATDAAFAQNAGISIDDYMRLRARRGISSPDAIRLRAENAKLKRELAGKPSEQVAAKAKEEKPAEETKAPELKGVARVDWSSEIASDHKLRGFDGWNAKLDAEMRKYYDPDMDEYGADPDEVADKILKRSIEEMMGEEEPAARAAPARTRPRVAPKNGKDATPSARDLTPKASTAQVDSIGEDDVKVRNMRPADLLNWALKRHELRAKGQLE